MGYKVYRVKEKDALSVRSSTDGYQPKFLVDNGTHFIKVQCELARTLRDDWRVEDIASRACTQLGIYAVKQIPCKVEISTNRGILKRYGVVSDNFEKAGLVFLSYSRLMEYCSQTFEIPFERLNVVDKLKRLVLSTCKATNLDYALVRQYFFNMITVDLLVLNQDRHFKNFGVFYNNILNRYEIARLFDFGMGLFENDTVFDNTDSLDGCLRYSYISPYGEDPFDLAKILLSLPSYRIYLKGVGVNRLNLSKDLFIHPCAYKYYVKMKGLLSNV